MSIKMSIMNRNRMMNPFFRLSQVGDELDRFFGGDNESCRRRNWTAPAVNVSEDSESWIYTFEIPGIAAENIDLSIKEGVLTLKGRRTAVETPEGTTLHRTEFSEGEYEFSRSLTLPDSIDEENIQAETENGLLRVVLKKTAEKKEKKIQILPRIEEDN